MARHIQLLDIDTQLNVGDPAIVNKIAMGHNIRKPKGDGDRNFYSFATKYCNWHNRDNYPIFDDFVEKILVAYVEKDKFSTFEKSELRDFKRLKTVILDFKIFYRLTKYTLKEIDKFLWIYGKEKFPRFYKKKQNKL